VTSARRTAHPSASIVPRTRLFPAPSCPFETELAVLGAGTHVREDDRFAGVGWIASEDLPDAPLWVTIAPTSDARADDAHEKHDAASLAHHVIDGLRATTVPAPAERTIVVGSAALADRLTSSMEAAGLRRRDQTFFGIAARTLADGDALPLEALVGDEAWRDWSRVERAILCESRPHDPPNDALLERIVDFKRRQQRHSPSIRRFVGRDEHREPVAMIGYAPFAPCDLGFAPAGVLVRLRDVAVMPHARRHGVATSLLRALAATAIEECEATQVLIGVASDAPAASLYRKVGARDVGRFVTFHGAV
jgi:ribosomal protein S18 acetylase RimI-like enzyme